jgi:uncharacterized membrane protein
MVAGDASEPFGRRVVKHLAVGVVIGVLVGVLSNLVAQLPTLADVLLGYIGFGLGFALPTLVSDMRLGPDATRERMATDDPGAGIADVIAIGSALASLLAIGALIAGGKSQTAVDALISFVAVGVGWVTIHTVYALRYARLYYYGETSDIDFNTGEPPRFSDFVYFSFNLGMTYQVSDTPTTTSALRRVVSGHCLLSWVYGVVIIGSTINLVIGLSQGN